MVRRLVCLATVAGLGFGALADLLPTGEYVQNGLLAHWDGIDNQADGSHHDDASTWKDKVAGYEFALSDVTVGDRYLGFNGSNSYGQLATNAATAFPSGAKTVEILVKLDSTGNGIAFQGPTGSGVAFGPYSSYILLGNLGNTVGYNKPGTDVTNAYCTVYGANNYPSTLNLNGVAVESVNAKNYWGTVDSSAWLGRRSNGTYFNGRIYSIRVYDRALLAEEIAYNHALDRARFLDDETAYASVPRFRIADIPFVVLTGAACEPLPEVLDLFTGQPVDSSNFDFTYENNTAQGTGTVIVTGRAGSPYAGQVGRKAFVIGRLLRAKGDALDSGSGASWADAMTWTNAIQCAATSGVPCEVWVAGTNLLTASKSVAFKQPTVIRGGFAGTERTPEERPAGRRSVVDGQELACCLSFSCTAPVTVESLLLTRSPNQALYCGTCSADVLVTNCAITVSGASGYWGGNYKAPIETVGGGGATFVGTSAATLRLCGCDFSGMSSKNDNDAGSGGGAYFKGYKRVYLDDCTVMTNASRCWRASQAFGLQFSNQTFEMTRCQVLGNRCTGGSGIAVQMSGSCSGSVMRNCIFAGNVNSAGSTGVVHVNMNATASTLLVENCTFAYNFVSGTSALCISCGTVSVRNTIFYANMRSLTSTRGADIHVATAGTADVAYGLFGGSGTAYCTSAGDGVLTLDGNAVAADPLFVTDTESFKALAKASAVPSGTWTVPGNATLCSFDLHLLSSEGYFDATGGLHTAAGVLSPAIDAADPEDDLASESEPNGGRRNLGAYGGTCFASRTPYADARVSGAITASWPTAYTQPEIRFALGGEGVYSATAVVRVSTDGGETWCFQSDALSGLTNGEAIAVLVPAYFPEGGELTVSVSVTAAGKTSVSTTEEPIAVEGALPPWDGKGGGAGVVHVRPGATGRGTGASWTDAVTTFAEGLALLSKTRSELWFAGTNELAAGVSLSAGYPVTIRGGFVGVENALEERPRGRISVLDGQDAADSCFSLTHSQVALVDSILFTRSTQRGFYASSSADLTLTNCAVRCCAKASGWGGNYKAPIETVGGGGATFVGTSAATVRLVGCDLSGMSSFTDHDAGSGGGAYFKGYRHAYLDNCTVMTNAVRADRAAQATGLQFSNQPATLEGCLFAGNRPTRSGIVVQFSGACSNSVLRNCRFVGSVDSGGSGLVCANMSTSSDTLLVENCTFAYNLVPNCSALRVNTGAATVRNSIFFGNVKVGTSANGADIACGANGAATAEWSFFGGTGADYTTGSSTVSPNCITTGDPLFVTTTEAFLTLTGVAALPVGSGSFPSPAASCALDVHLLSSAGHRVNGDESWHLAEGLRSPAIDGGDTASDFSREPDDNGGCINMGAYGNTPEASKTPSFKVGVDGAVTIEFEDGYTQPTVRFTMGGEGAYSAEAVISVYVDGSETPAFVSAPQKGLSIGMPVGFRVPAYFRPGATLVAKVDLSAGDKLASASSEGTPAAGELPPWDGKGGGANVVHVRPGATGRGDGSSWTDAYVDFHTALKSLSAGKDEVWVSGTNVLTSSSPDFAFTASLAIRGGFDATECAASARKGGSRSRVDGCDAYNCLTFHNAADVTVTLDGIDFVRGGSHGVRKASGAGDLFVTNCGFLVCGAVNTVNSYQSDINGNGGAGVGITGGGTATFVGCDIRGNRLSGSGHDGCVGVGLMAFGLRRLYLDSCNVISNVNNFWRGGGGQGVYCYNTPVEITKTRFAANDASCSVASVLWLNGSCSGSVVRNCVFTGNSNGAANGMFRVSMGAADMTVLVENCTLAYNFDSGNTALNLVKGDATVRNCVFMDNLVAASSAIGADINVGDEARADVSHSLFGVEGMNSVTCGAGGETNFLAGVHFGDAKLVTDAETFRAGAKVTGEVPRSGWTLPAVTVRAAYNVHLRGGSGYVDETTGEKVKTWARSRWASPAMDAGDPAARCVEPKPNGHRVNLGAYGNTPWATMSPAGTALIVR